MIGQLAGCWWLFIILGVCAAPLEKAAELFEEQSDIHVQIDVCSRHCAAPVAEEATGETGGDDFLLEISDAGVHDLAIGGAEYLLDDGEIRGIVQRHERRFIAGRASAIIVPAGNPKNIQSVEDMAGPGVRVGVSVIDCLKGLWEDITGRLGILDQIRKNISYCANGCIAMVFLESVYSFLLLMHLFVTFVLVGSMTHGLLIVISYLRGKFNRQNLELYYTKVALWSYVIVYVIGALIYPAYRIHMRYDYFDQQLPWATGLFEVKEHWGAVGLAMFFVLYFLRKNLQPAEEKDKLWLYVPLCFLLNIIVWYKVVVGCYLSLLKGSWS